jgi:hypothetical protein
MRRGLAVSAGVLLALCCATAALVAFAYFFLVPTAEARPVVLIDSPRHGDQVHVGEAVIVQATARDKAGVVSVELWVDGQRQDTQTSSIPGGISPFPLLSSWQPFTPGAHTLTVRAFSVQGGRAQASAVVETVYTVDLDSDGVADDVDLCPGEPGRPSASGCPDLDRDGIYDAEDACPDEAGLPEADGCPAPSEGDRDGDGLLDEADACPDEAGPPRVGGCPDADGDGVADAEDVCPEEPGPAEHDGCPVEGDLDGDGVPDDEDGCPEEWGLPEDGGCPDFDGDGIRDIDDRCPDVWGLPEHDGCPDTDRDGTPDEEDLHPDDPGESGGGGAPDGDGDGVPDEEDECPAHAGEPPSGCPPPGEGEDADGDGIPADEEGPEDLLPGLGYMGSMQRLVFAEFQALDIEVFDDYDAISCYASLAGQPMERYGPFEVAGERHWSIPDELRSRVVGVLGGEALTVRAECWGYNLDLGPEGGWGRPWDLGSFERSHSPLDWDGHVITVASDEGPEGASFQVQYRVCLGSCEEAEFQPPTIMLRHNVMGTDMLFWGWDGDPALVDGFKLYANGNYVFALPIADRNVSVRHFEPPCGREIEFHMTAYRGQPLVPERESPPSNTEIWEGDACQRTVRVSFESLATPMLRADRKGPIKGTFVVNDQALLAAYGPGLPSFDATDDPKEYLRSGRSYQIAELFDDINSGAGSCIGGAGACTSNYAPDVNFVEVELEPFDYLVWVAHIEDDDGHTIHSSRDEIPPGEIVPGCYTLEQGGVELTVCIDVLIGPEAGDRPDLVISDLTRTDDSHQLRIHVFNRSASLDDEDITIRIERPSDGEVLDTATWSDVSIATGGYRVLDHDLVVDSFPIYDLRLVLDPDNAIEEEDEDNNIYERPLLVRVEFEEIRTGHHLESNIDHAEYVFWARAGHGPSVAEIDWVGEPLRCPERSVFLYCVLEATCPIPDTGGHFGLSGDRYTLEFEVPASDNVYVSMWGHEVDPPGVDFLISAPDFMGEIFAEYGPDVAHGDGGGLPSRMIAGTCSEGDPIPSCRACCEGICDDLDCGLREENHAVFHASWLVTRVH